MANLKIIENLKLTEISENNVQVLCNLSTLFRYDLMPYIQYADGAYLNAFGTFGNETDKTHSEDANGWNIWCKKPGILYAFLIIFEEHLAGFVTVSKPPHAHPSVDFRLSNLFVINKYRRFGIGRHIMDMIFMRFPGKWEVSWIRENTAAASFWRNVVSENTIGIFEETIESVEIGFENSPRLLFRI